MELAAAQLKKAQEDIAAAKAMKDRAEFEAAAKKAKNVTLAGNSTKEAKTAVKKLVEDKKQDKTANLTQKNEEIAQMAAQAKLDKEKTE